MLLCDTHADTLYRLQERPAEAADVSLCCFSGTTRVQVMSLWTGPTGRDEGLLARELTALERLKAQGARQITRLCDAKENAPNIMLSLEGGEPLESGEAGVEQLAALGVVMAGLVWNHETALAQPAVGGGTQGLTQLGRDVARALMRRRIALDVSHLNDAGFADVCRLGRPFLASHSCCRALCDHPRNLTDEQIRALIGAGGYIGVNFYPPFLTNEKAAYRRDVLRHIDRICQLGGEKNVGLGSDFDGIDEYPEGLRTAADVPALLDDLAAAGYPQATVRAIAGQNFAAFMQRVAQV